jgi:ABC-type nitrate/sulfonate/bicarbonate transport system substrate-binding protein
MTPAFRSIVLALALTMASGAAAASTQEQIGSWVLTCPNGPAGSEPCLLHAAKRFFDEAGVTCDLEVQALGQILVPVITLRGLPNDVLIAASLAGKTEVSLQFGDEARENLACALTNAGYICSPKDDAARRLAAELPSSRSMTVLLSVAVTGMKPLPVQKKSLDLTGTNEALARLRRVGPTQVAAPQGASAPPTPAALKTMTDKALKAAGYSNGLADLQDLLAKYRGKQP